MDSESPLEQLYRDALYEVDCPTGTIIVRIGEAAPTGLPVPLAVVTAWNPGAARPGEAENQAANRRLEAEITRRGWRWLPARGRNAAATHVEPSFAIMDITREGALALGRQFGQAAIVFVDSKGVSLLWCG
jgi:hypothetical protein